MSSVSPQDIYAKYLRQPYGYPLRIPEPSPALPESYQDDGLQIGDVGYVDTHGRFHVLFNIRYSPGHTLHRRRGVPDQFEPIELDLDEVTDINSNELPKNRVISSGVVQLHRDKDEPKLDYEFLSSSTAGAILILPVGAIRHELRENEEFRKIATENARRWCAFARRDSLYLITSLYKASSWTLASFDLAPRNGQIIVEHDSTGTYSWDCRFNVDWRHSPEGNDNRNQTIFISGFKIAVRWWTPEPMIEWVPRSPSIWSTLFLHICWFARILIRILKTFWQCFRLQSVDHGPRASQPYHPSDVINRYLLDKDPNTQVAITHDRQWMGMLDEEALTLEELMQEDRLRCILSDKYMWASDDDAVYLLRKTEDTNVPCIASESLGGFSLPMPSINSWQIVITRMRVENIAALLRRMPIGFYVTVQFNGSTRRTANKSVLVHESVIEWDDEIILPLDPSVEVQITVRASFEFDPMLGNGQVLHAQNMTVGDFVGSMHLIVFPSIETSPSCPSLLLTLERRCPNISSTQSRYDSSRNDNMPHWEHSSVLASETDLGHQAFLRYHEHYAKENLEKAIEHFEHALVLCPAGHACRAPALSNLAMADFIRCQVDGTYTALDAAISLFDKAVELRPDGHPDRPVTLLYLAQVLCCRYGKLEHEEDITDEVAALTMEVKDICSEGTHEHRAVELALQTCACYQLKPYMEEELDEWIPELNRAIQKPPDGYFDIPQRLMNLSIALRKRHRFSDGPGNIDRLITLNKQALRLTRDGEPVSADYLSHLGKSLLSHHFATGEVGSLEEGIISLQKALQFYPLGHHDRTLALVDLADCFIARFGRLETLTELEEPISFLQAELNFPRLYTPNRVSLLEKLAELLHTRFGRFKKMIDLDDAISLQRSALDFAQPNNPIRFDLASRLASLLSTRFDLHGAVSDLEEEVRLFRDNLEHCSPGHPRHWDALDELARALQRRFWQLGAMDDLNEAIAIHRSTLGLDPPFESGRTSLLCNLAHCLTLRFNQLNDVTDLVEATTLCRAAMEFCQTSHLSQYIPMMHLATYLQTWFEITGSTSCINEAITLHREAMRPGSLTMPSSTNVLAHCLLSRFKQSHVMADLDEAIAFHRTSVKHRETHSHPFRSMSLNNLATCLRIRFEDKGMIADLDEAFMLYLGAALDYCSTLQLHHPGEPDTISVSRLGLALCLTSRFRQSKERSDLAFHHYSILSHVSLGVTADLEVAKAWVDAAEEFGHHTRVLAYQTLLRFLVHRLTPCPPLPHHAPMTEKLASSLAMDAFSACLRDGNLPTAVELLEQGRGVFWTGFLRLRSPLDEVNGSCEDGKRLAERFTRFTLLHRSVPDVLGDLLYRDEDWVWKLNSRLQNVVSDIRKLPGLSRFLEPVLFCELQQGAIHGAVVIVNASQYSCDALIVLHHRDPVHVPLKPTKAHVAELASRLRSLPAISEVEERTKAAILLLQELWSLVVSPITEILQKFQPIQSRIWWYPTAEFSLLPLHAAGPHEEGQPNFTDLYISSYTPSITELMRARRKLLSYSSTEQPHFVAVDTAPDIGEDGRGSAERHLAPLMQRIAPLVTTTCVQGQDSRVARVAEELGRNEFVHIDCPAIANPQRLAFESSLILSDGHLKMEDIMRLDLQQAKFAFLSTTHTTAGDEQGSGSSETGEMVHIAAAMQCAGFPSVVGPMWAVDPVLARVMAARFYENMVVGDNLKSRRLDHTRAALALHQTITSCTEIPFDQRIMWLHMGI